MSENSAKIRRRMQAFTSPAFVRAVDGALFELADQVKAAAQHGITRGSVSGKSHKPSLPGQFPHNDSGVLKNNIEAALTGQFEATVTASAPYSAALEMGTSKIAARPFMRPARDQIAPRGLPLLNKRIRAAIRSALK